MNLYSKILNKKDYIKNCLDFNKKSIEEIKKNKSNIYILGAPFHSNMGDQAQTYCSIKWIEKNYPGYKINVFTTTEVSALKYNLLKKIKKLIKSEDIIFLHSGYHLTDLYIQEEKLNRKVIEIFKLNRIIMLPQTILFQSKEEEKNTIDIYNKHKKLTILCRDDLSYDKAKEMFKNATLLKYPDIVTTLIGTKQFDFNREKILLCMRNDGEAFYSKEQVESLKNRLEKIDKVDITDTTIELEPNYISNNREKVLNDIFDEYSKYKVIITDRYHGTIFSLIANTPVIVLSSTDHKLSSGVKWFPEEFKDYVKYVDDINNVEKCVNTIYSMDYSYKLSRYFNQKYYDNLTKQLGQEV